MTQTRDTHPRPRSDAANGVAEPFASPVTAPYVEKVKRLVSSDRFDHIRRVALLALQIARANGFSAEDQDRVLLASLLHDAARDLSDAQLLKLVSPANEVEKSHPLSMHGRAARRLAKQWGVDDEAVLGAIEGHVFGVDTGDGVGAAVYVADVSEPARGVNEDVRETALSDLWEAYAMAVTCKVDYLRSEGKEIHPATLRAYESLT